MTAGGASEDSAPWDARRVYLDWLRGVAVLIMIEAHTVDAWTRLADRGRWPFGWALVVGGFGAPIFLFLAGMTMALAAGARIRKGLTETEAARRALRRGWQIFGLAFLFRLQSMVISGGALRTLLKVDILNIMGVSMLAAATVWRLVQRPWLRAVTLAALALALAMLTPIVRAAPFLAALPDPLENYLRPSPGRTTFTIFPWSGFLFAGAAIGMWLDAVRTVAAERRANAALAALGVTLAAAGYASSFLPPIFAETSFWTSSPTFFILRLGVLIAAIPVAYLWCLVWRGRSPVQELGVASFFVYWIHVEMVYGLPTSALHRALSLEQVAVAMVAFTVFLFGLVKLKDRLQGAGGWRQGAGGRRQGEGGRRQGEGLSKGAALSPETAPPPSP